MTEQEWLTCTDPSPLVAFVCATASDRKLRLFGCACCRRIWHRLSVKTGWSSIVAAELHADGLISDADLLEARARAEVAHINPCVPDSAAYCTTWVNDCPHWPVSRIVLGVDDSPLFAADFCESFDAERACQATLVREVFGDPFREVSVDPTWLHWNDNTVFNLAQAIYDERTFDRLPILADALEEAGCDSADLLSHLRNEGPHVRGCWPLDLLLGKS